MCYVLLLKLSAVFFKPLATEWFSALPFTVNYCQNNFSEDVSALQSIFKGESAKMSVKSLKPLDRTQDSERKLHTSIPDTKSRDIQGREKSLQILLSYSKAEKLSRARKKYLATTYKNFFSALYRGEKKGLYGLLSNSPAVPGRYFSQPHTNLFSRLCNVCKSKQST